MDILDINTSDIFNAIGGGSPLSIIDSVVHPSYSIRNNGKSTVALQFSGMNSIQPSAGANIVTAPIETGKYQSINKISRPGRVVCDVVISGLSGLTGSLPNIFDMTLVSQSDVLTKIKDMLNSAALYDIETPKDVYESYDLIDYSYTVNSKRGVSLLVVSLVFEEVRQQMDVTLSNSQSQKKSTNDAQSNAPYGMGDVTKQCAVTPAKIDYLQPSWDNLKAAVSGASKAIDDNISPGFISSIDTVKGLFTNASYSVTQKQAGLVKSIAGSVT
ncbi:phage baseplate protein [Enterobacteriaceae bacterium LUAb1]